MGSLCTLVRAVASFGGGTEDACSGLGNSPLPEMPLCQQGEQGQLLFAATMVLPHARDNHKHSCAARCPRPRSAGADLWTPINRTPSQAGLGFIYYRHRKAGCILSWTPKDILSFLIKVKVCVGFPFLSCTPGLQMNQPNNTQTCK